MRIYTDIEEFKSWSEKKLVNIGNFDGVHRGHQQLISYLKSESKRLDLKLCVYTFDVHPRVYFEGMENFILSPVEQRVEELKKLGVDALLILDFASIAQLSAEKFLQSFVKDIPDLYAFYLGYDFKFGKDKKGDFVSASNVLKNENIVVHKAPVFKEDGESISSSRVRDYLLMGEVGQASNFLGRPYSLTGSVVQGQGRGKQIGVPTANLAVDPLYLIPQKGVYCTRAIVDGITYDGVTNIGINPTFGRRTTSSIETHLFSLDRDIYGHSMTLEFHQFLRLEQRFNDVESLVRQIQKDMSEARTFWKS